jgi:hypothetical protein
MRNENVMITILILMFSSAMLFLSFELSKKTRECIHLVNSINSIKDKRFNDSVLISEYQTALDILIKSDSATANKFMRVVESINIKQ